MFLFLRSVLSQSPTAFHIFPNSPMAGATVDGNAAAASTDDASGTDVAPKAEGDFVLQVRAKWSQLFDSPRVPPTGASAVAVSAGGEPDSTGVGAGAGESAPLDSATTETDPAAPVAARSPSFFDTLFQKGATPPPSPPPSPRSESPPRSGSPSFFSSFFKRPRAESVPIGPAVDPALPPPPPPAGKMRAATVVDRPAGVPERSWLDGAVLPAPEATGSPPPKKQSWLDEWFPEELLTGAKPTVARSPPKMPLPALPTELP